MHRSFSRETIPVAHTALYLAVYFYRLQAATAALRQDTSCAKVIGSVLDQSRFRGKE
jgi:hypothetical protein